MACPKQMCFFSVSKKPILLTCASPAGIQGVKIESDSKISILDPTNSNEPWFLFNRKKPRVRIGQPQLRSRRIVTRNMLRYSRLQAKLRAARRVKRQERLKQKQDRELQAVSDSNHQAMYMKNKRARYSTTF